jgi:hypothetical protein
LGPYILFSNLSPFSHVCFAYFSLGPQNSNHCLNTLTDCGLFGPFQQLLRAANSGVLSASNDGALTVGANPTLPIGGHSQFHVNSEETATQFVCDDGYCAGTESENDSPIDGVSSDLFVQENNTHTTPENVDYVASFIDPIGTEEFMHGRDFDYGDFSVGIDDTELNDLDFQNNIDLSSEEIVNCSNGIALDQSLLDGNVPNDEFSLDNEKDLSPCALGGCGCSDHVYAQEISARYEEGVRLGFRKR